MNHLWHLMDPGRVDAARSYLCHEHRKMFPFVPDDAREAMENDMWLWTNSEWHQNPRTFWNYFCGVQMAMKPRSDLWKYASARNVSWSAEFVSREDIALSKGDAGDPPYGEPPILLKKDNGPYLVLDGKKRLRSSCKNEMQCYIASVAGNEPLDYWVPTSWLLQLATLPDPVGPLGAMVADSNVAMRELSDKVLAGRKDKMDLIKALKKHRTGR